MEKDKLKTPIEYINEALSIYFKKENMIFFVKTMSIAVILSTILSFINSYYFSSSYSDYHPMMMVITFFSTVIVLWVQVLAYFSVIDMGESEFEIMKKSFKNILRFFGISLVLGLIFFFGVLLLVVPGIIFGLWYSFVIFLVLDKNMKLKEAMRTSKALVKDKMMKVFGRLTVFSLFSFVASILVSIIPFAGNIVLGLLSPLFLLPVYLLCKDLVGANN